MAEPSLEQWRSLFQIGAEFRAAAPWRTFSDADLFAVEDPESGMVGYCSVLGAGGEEFGLSVFPGIAGLKSYFSLVEDEDEDEDEDESPDPELAFTLNCIGLSFSDREDLEKHDLDVIKTLGLRFRGRGAWPWFRSMRPGYVPWHLDADEARLLDYCLRQTLVVVDAVKTRGLKLGDAFLGEPVLTRCRRGDVWGDEWRELPEIEEEEEEEEEEEAPSIDEARLQRLRAREAIKRGAWHVGSLLYPVIVGDRGERPFYPLLFLVASDEGLVLDSQFLKPSARADDLMEAMLALLERSMVWPQRLLLMSADLEWLFEPLTSALRIPIEIDDGPFLPSLMADLQQFLADR